MSSENETTDRPSGDEPDVMGGEDELVTNAMGGEDRGDVDAMGGQDEFGDSDDGDRRNPKVAESADDHDAETME